MGVWRRADACVGYDFRGPQLLEMYLVERTASGMQRSAWPRHYHEGSTALVCRRDHRETKQGCTSTARLSTAVAVEEWPQIWHKEAEGFVVTLTMDNIWHTLFHVVPTFELFVEDPPSAPTTHFLPRYTILWPSALKRARPEGAVSAPLPPVAAWRGWELMMRALSGGSDRGPSARQNATHQLLFDQPRTLHCYHRLRGGHGPFWPSVLEQGQLRAATDRLRAVRRAVLASLPHAHALRVSEGVEAPRARVIFVLRRRDRAIANEAELINYVGGTATLAPGRVRFTVLEQLSLRQQIELVSTSTGLAGVHGAGLTWVVFLPAREGGPPFALLEILPRRMERQGTHAFFDYFRLSGTPPTFAQCRDRHTRRV